jgi:hypothetical protein
VGNNRILKNPKNGKPLKWLGEMVVGSPHWCGINPAPMKWVIDHFPKTKCK